jgi:hypothetical protein
MESTATLGGNLTTNPVNSGVQGWARLSLRRGCRNVYSKAGILDFRGAHLQIGVWT